MIISRFFIILFFLALAYAQPRIPAEVLPDNQEETSSLIQVDEEVALETRDHLLIISPRFDDPGLIATEAYLNAQGQSYKALIASQEGLSLDKLVDEAGKGLYQAIILTEGALSFNEQGHWKSAFTQTEWQRLWEYQRTYGVRQVSLYTFPSVDPEAYGLSLVKAIDTSDKRHAVSFTSHAKEQLGTSLETIYLTNAYGYQTRLEPTEGIITTPLLIDEEGYIFAATSSHDGRERLVFTMAQSEFAEHTEHLLPLAFNWLSPATTTATRFQPGFLNNDLERFFIINTLFILAFVLLNWLRQRRKARQRVAMNAGD